MQSAAPSVDAIGLIFVEFEEVESAAKAQAALHGRTFGDSVVAVLPYPEAGYAEGVLTDVRVALAAAAAEAAAKAEAAAAVAEAARRRTGAVRMWNTDKGFGFVDEDNSSADEGIFVHARSLVTHASSAALEVGQRVSFLVELRPDSRHQAMDVRDRDGVLPVDEAAHQAALIAVSCEINQCCSIYP